MRAESFRKKKINRFKIIFASWFVYTTDVYPPQPTYREFICTHLFLLVIICENLFHHLKQIFYHQNMIMIPCWFRSTYFMYFAFNFSHFISRYFFIEQSVFKFTKLSCDILSFCCIRFFTINIFLWNTFLTLIQQAHHLFFFQTRLSFYQ